MDTVQIGLELKSELTFEDYKRVEMYINNYRSSFGHTFCDVLEIRNEHSIGIKISYPRYFYGNNVYLISKVEECFQVQRSFCEMIYKLDIFKDALIYLERVDIPFTFIIDERYDFYSYTNSFSIMAMVHANKRSKGSRKMYSDIIDKKPETLTYADTKTISAYNQKIMIYDQYKNLESKTKDNETLEIFSEDFVDLKKRMRIEASKRIKRNPFTIESFMIFNIVDGYLEQMKKLVLDDMLDFQVIDQLYDQKAYELSCYLIEQRQSYGFNYENFILKNMEIIHDYEILRRALKIGIDNTKTRESAVTAVRRALNGYSNSNGIIVMDVYQKLKEIKSCIENFKII